MKTLTVLCVPHCGYGHVNPMTALGIALKNRGHRVVFAIEISWKGKLEKWGFEEQLYEESETSGDSEDTSMKNAKLILERSQQYRLPVTERKSSTGLFYKFFVAVKFSHKQMLVIVQNVKPDIIIDDLLIFMPALLSANAPIVKFNSMHPLYAIVNNNLPPMHSGLPLNDNTDWEKHRKIFQSNSSNTAKELNDWCKLQNPMSPNQYLWRAYQSTNLNIYMYPKAAMEDYLARCDLGVEWIGLDHCIRPVERKYEVPKFLKDGESKIIFISMGTLGSAVYDIMFRLTTLLSKSEHKFIVAKGMFHDKYNLPDNMWGEAFLPQLDILPQVDLVITHGGNNTFVESLYYGKPMIVFPLFGDQFANAQRAVEMKIGYRFDAYKVNEYELHEAINTLLHDKTINEKLKQISQEMRESKQMDKVIENIELVANNPKFPTLV